MPDIMRDDDSEARPAVSFELYKLAVQSVDSIIARRTTTNSFFLAIQAGLISVISLSQGRIRIGSTFLVIAAMAAMLICAAWLLMLRAYRLLYSLRIQVVVELEQHLAFPVKPYTIPTRAIGVVNRFNSVSTIELYIPLTFALLYASLVVTTIM